jgi:hypothetical protein
MTCHLQLPGPGQNTVAAISDGGDITAIGLGPALLLRA